MDMKQILSEQIEAVKPSEEVLEKIDEISKRFCEDLRRKLKERKISADVFIGGSLAKDTLVKKDKYDVDVFVRFAEKYGDKDISKLLKKVLGGKVRKVHGSRDYYQLDVDGIVIEIVPVLKIKRPSGAKNITDLSYFHVNYVVNKIKKDKKIGDEIMLAKTFAYAQDCYGAESYIHGFSGYALELLICYYGSFLKFIKAVVKSGDEKIIIDDAKFYRRRKTALIELNESKIKGPMILIDPTFKERNALASLSYDTFGKFKKACHRFLKKPSAEFFKRVEISKGFKDCKDLKIVSVKTSKQAGDIAGTKSKKFFGFFLRRMGKEFEIKKSGFDYNEKKNVAYFYLVLEAKTEEIVKGPPVSDAGNVRGFRKAHSNSFVKKGFVYARVSHKISFEKWFSGFLKKDRKVIREMSVKRVELRR